MATKQPSERNSIALERGRCPHCGGKIDSLAAHVGRRGWCPESESVDGVGGAREYQPRHVDLDDLPVLEEAPEEGR